MEATKGFFAYISMADLGQTGLCFMGFSARGCTLTDVELLRLQGTVFNSWLSHMKSKSDAASMLQDIPVELWLPLLARCRGLD